MSYPGESNFTTGARGAGWWKYTTGAGVVSVCASQGLSIGRGAQSFLKDGQTRVQTTAVFGAHMANTNNLTIDGIIGPATIKVAYAYFAAIGTPAALLADIEQDFNDNNRTNALGVDVSRPGNPLRPGTMKALLWLAAHHDGDLSRVQLPPGAVPIRWGVAPASDGAAAGTKTCWRMDQPVPPEALPVGGSPGGNSAGGSTAIEPAAGGTTTERTTTGMSTGAKVALGAGLTVAGIGGAVGIGYAISKSGKKKRKKRKKKG